MFRTINVFLILIGLAAAAHADLWQDLAQYKYGDKTEAPAKLEELLANTSPDQYAPIEAELIKIVGSASATQDGKAWACRKLQRIGTAKCIPALSGLLLDPILSHYARLTLECMKGDAQAIAALRQALDKAPDNLKAGLIDSLGEHRDQQSVSAIARLMTHSNKSVAENAMRGLGKISGATALSALQKAQVPADRRAVLGEAIVACAKPMGASGYGAMQQIFEGDFAPVQRLAALEGMAQVDATKAGPVILKLIQDKPGYLRSGALRVVATAGDEVLSDVIADALGKMKPNDKAATIIALGERGDKSVLPVLMADLSTGDQDVADALSVALAELAGADQVEPLLKAAVKNDKFYTTLQSIGGCGKVNAKLVQMLDNEQLVQHALQVLDKRGARSAAAKVIQLVSSSDPAVRQAAWAAVPSVANEDHVGALMKMLIAIEDARQRSYAQNAIRNICAQADDRTRCFNAISPYYEKAESDTKQFILMLGSSIGTDEALALERKALRSSDADLRKAAVKALAAWPNTDAMADLLNVARSGQSQAENILALRGYIELADRERDWKKQLGYFKTALELAGTAEKKQIIGKLQNFRNIESLRMLKSMMQDAELRNDAELAVINILSRSQRDRKRHTEEKAAILRAIILGSKNKDTVKRARSELKELEK